MLDQRANYDEDEKPRDPTLSFDGDAEDSVIPKRRPARVGLCYMYPTEVLSHDYFHGAFMSLVVEEDGWEISKPTKSRHPKREKLVTPKEMAGIKAPVPKRLSVSSEATIQDLN